MPPVPAPDRPAFAVILAGGAGERLGLRDKPGLLLGDRRLVDIALDAVWPALTVVVGPDRVLPDGVLRVLEDPPGGGPAAALVAGLRRLALHRSGGGQVTDQDLVVVLAADLPTISAPTVDLLSAALVHDRLDGVVLIDPTGRSQYLAGVWRWTALLRAVDLRSSWHGGRISELLGPLIGARLPVDAAAAADVDTPADLQRWGVVEPESRPGHSEP